MRTLATFRLTRTLGILVILASLTIVGPSAHAKMVQIDGKTYDVAVPGEFAPGQVIVQARSLAAGSSAASFAATGAAIATLVGGRVKATIPQHNLFLIELAALPQAMAESLTAQKAQINGALQALQQSPLVQLADYNYKKSIFPPVKKMFLGSARAKAPASAPLTLFSEVPSQLPLVPLAPVPTIISTSQWHLDKIKFWQAGDIPATAPTIAVVDTGVDYEHPDLSTPFGKVIKGKDFWYGDNDPMDDIGHGTHVAGIAAASGSIAYGALGVSPSSRILAVKVFSSSGSADSFTCWQGWLYARDYPGVKVINFSGGGFAPEDSQFFTMEQAVVNSIVAKKVVFVCAAGNSYDFEMFQTEGYENWRCLPAWFNSSLTVAASEESDYRTLFSNYNLTAFGGLTFNYNFVKMVAPGWNILSTFPTWNIYYTWLSGTSMASPVVAGAAARVLAKFPSFTPTQVLTQMKNTGKLLGPANGWYVSERRIDLMRALSVTGLTGFGGAVYTGRTGRPLSGAKVEIVDHDAGTTVATAYTNAVGFFTAAGLTGNTFYDIRVSKTKYSTITYTGTSGAGIQAKANYILDVPQVLVLNQVMPDNQWSLMIAWNSWQPGYWDANKNYSGQLPYYPFHWFESPGTYFAPRLRLPNGNLLHIGNAGNRFSSSYYAQMTADPWFINPDNGNNTSTPVSCFIITNMITGWGNPYKLYCNLNNGADPYGFYEWGNYAASRAVAYLFKGAAPVGGPIAVASATPMGTTNNWWYIASINPDTNTGTIINQRLDMEP